MNVKVSAMGMIAHSLGDALFDMDALADQVAARDKEIDRLKKENESLRLTMDALDRDRTALQAQAQASESRVKKGKG